MSLHARQGGLGAVMDVTPIRRDEAAYLMELSAAEPAALADLEECVRRLRAAREAKVALSRLEPAVLRELIARRWAALDTRVQR